MDTTFLTTLHSHSRNLVFLTAVIAIVLALVAWLRTKPVNKSLRLSACIYSIVATVQLLIGIVLLVLRWNDFGDGLRHRLEHAFLMLVAVGLTHMVGRFASAPVPIGARNTFFTLTASLLIILLGVWILPQGAAILGLGS